MQAVFFFHAFRDHGCKAGWAGKAGGCAGVHLLWSCLRISSRSGPRRSLVTETWAVISFELPHESYKAEKPQILYFFFLYNWTALFFPSFLEVVFHIGLVVGNPSRYGARAAVHLFGGRMPGSAAEDLVLLSDCSYSTYLSWSVDFAWRLWEPVFSHDSDISGVRMGWKYPVADVLVHKLCLHSWCGLTLK